MTEPCPHCGKPLEDDEHYHAGYEIDDLRVIPNVIKEGAYCHHIKGPGMNIIRVKIDHTQIEDRTKLLLEL